MDILFPSLFFFFLVAPVVVMHPILLLPFVMHYVFVLRANSCPILRSPVKSIAEASPAQRYMWPYKWKGRTRITTLISSIAVFIFNVDVIVA